MSVDIILNTLAKNFPQIAGYAFIIFLTGYVVIKCTIFYIKVKQDCGKINRIDNLLGRIDKGFNLLNRILMEKNIIGSSCYSEGESPRKLNDRGERLYKESGAERLFIRIQNKLIDDLGKENQDSLLELESNALKVVLNRMNDIEFKDVQNYAYNNPQFENNALNYTDILFLIALNLRDLYIERKEIKNL